MSKPYCVESAAVKVSVDELMTEMLRRVPLETVQEVLFMASQGARTRLQEKRHDRYKSEKLFRRAAKRLPEIPSHLAAAVGMRTDGELTSPDITVEPVKPTATLTLGADGVARTSFVEGSPSEVVKELVTSAEDADQTSGLWDEIADWARTADGPKPLNTPTAQGQMVEPEPDTIEIDDEPTPPPSSADEFADLMDIPRFEDFEAVFASYPYVWETESKTGERRLVLGYASARNRGTDQLVRRNCAYTGPDGEEHAFNDLPSVVGVLKKAANGVRRHLKVLPYHPGAKVRFWTNVAGSGDREDLYRFILITEEGLEKVGSRVEFDEA